MILIQGFFQVVKGWKPPSHFEIYRHALTIVYSVELLCGYLAVLAADTSLLAGQAARLGGGVAELARVAVAVRGLLEGQPRRLVRRGLAAVVVLLRVEELRRTQARRAVRQRRVDRFLTLRTKWRPFQKTLQIGKARRHHTPTKTTRQTYWGQVISPRGFLK